MMIIRKTYKILFWIITFIFLLLGVGQVISIATNEDPSDLIITEFLAANVTGLMDEDGDYSDWIEIHNRKNQPVNLSGWSLTDDPAQPEKWRFPDVTLGSHEYLVVFASGKNRQSTGGRVEFHTNFKLGQEGEYLGLYNVFEHRMMDEVGPQFPRQLRDISYGRAGGEGRYGYFAKATPGEPNDVTQVWIGLASEVGFSVERGFYEEPFAVGLSTTTPGAEIRYTTDGSEPTEVNGEVYTEPISIEGTTLLRAVALKPGYLLSDVATHSYIFLDDVLKQSTDPPGFPATWGTYSKSVTEYQEDSPVMADYEMDPEIVNNPRYKDTIQEDLKSIPTLSIVMDMQSFDDIYSNPMERGLAWERPVSVELIDPNNDRESFQINAGIRIQGGTGRWEFMPKHSFRLYFRGRYGATKLEYPLFPDSPVERFDTLILRAGVNRSYAGRPETLPYESATYTRDEWLRASQIAVSDVGSHGLFVHLYLNGLYWGLYNVVEKPDASFAASYLGGEKEDWYAANSKGPISGADDRVEALLQRFARSGGLEGIEGPEKYPLIKPYLDTTQFVDNFILNWYVGNRDWPHNNWYAVVRNPSGQIKYFVWDGEWIWIDGAGVYLGKPVRRNTPRLLFEALTHYPDFKIELADRMYKHLFNGGALTDVNSQVRWMKINNIIDRAIVSESARWGDARYENPIARDDWLKARDDVLAQMEGNADRLIALAREAGYYPELDPPAFNQHGGLVARGFNLTMTSSKGTIYYTTDGSDPRMQVTSGVAPGAVVYDTPLLLTATTQVKARVLAEGSATGSGQVWSALNEATFRVVVQDSEVQLTEIMYNPVGGGDYEFLELQNVGDSEVDLSGMYFDEGIRYTFPSKRALAAGEYVVLVRNAAAFEERYPGVAMEGAYDGQLSNKGEKITLRDVAGNEIVSVAYDDENGWPISADGRGDSLVMIDLAGDPNNPRNWQASDNLDGSPGAHETGQ